MTIGIYFGIILCAEYLQTCSLGKLRCYGRFLNLPYPTKLKKQALIEEIIRAICEGTALTRSNRGAPIKNTYFPPEIPATLERLKQQNLENSFTPPHISTPKTEVATLQLSIAVEQWTRKQKQLLRASLDSLEPVK